MTDMSRYQIGDHSSSGRRSHAGPTTEVDPIQLISKQAEGIGAASPAVPVFWATSGSDRPSRRRVALRHVHGSACGAWERAGGAGRPKSRIPGWRPPRRA